MEIGKEKIELGEGVSIRWGAVKTLKVLNQKIQFALRSGLILEIAGLPPKQIDAIFTAYSRHLLIHT